VSNKLDRSFKINTISQGSPYSLEVKKTDQQWQDETNAWEKRCSMIIGGLESLKNCTPLFKVIGEDAYNSLLKHDSVRPSAGVVALISTAGAPRASWTVVRRKAYLAAQRLTLLQANQTPSYRDLNRALMPSSFGLPKKRSYVDLTE
jgi:hypothetical protein